MIHSKITFWMMVAIFAVLLCAVMQPVVVAQDHGDDHGDQEHPADTGISQDHGSDDHESDGHGGGHASGESGGGGHAAPLDVPIWTVLPFVIMLLCIAVLPLVCEHWWEHNSNRAKVAFPLGAIVAIYLAVVFKGAGITAIEHSVVEYLQFIFLLGSLYIISGGIVLRGDLQATPKVNTIFLVIGGTLASFIGTTGASMLLIRPLLKTNSERKHVTHTVIFFIFIVSNIGGCLTPLGDPPLFLGYLRGVPFAWTFVLWKEWLMMNISLLVIYFVWDSLAYKKEEAKDIVFDKENIAPLRLAGKINFLFLGGVICSVAFSSQMAAWFQGTSMGASLQHNIWFMNGTPFRELIMVAMVLGSISMTSKALKTENKFSYAPIAEVAILFIGIFLTMIPALQILSAKGSDMGVDTPAKFFWVTGMLSSFLDNAPTYLVFFETAKGMVEHGGLTGFGDLVAGIPVDVLVAISLGAVFMGANSYIGNGPNFMVKAVAEETGLKMPSFFGYMKYSFGILVPLFVVVTLLFLL